MTTAKRPYTIQVLDAKGHFIWAGGRTRSFATIEAARTAAMALAAALATDDHAATVIVKDGNYGATLERVEVEKV